MAHIDHRHGLVAQAQQIGKDLALARRVERGERLVEQQEARAHQQRAADRDALALAAGEIAGPPLEQARDIEQRDDACLLVGVVRQAIHAPPVVEILRDRHVREQPAVLEHVADAAPVRRHAEAAGASRTAACRCT